MFGSSVTEAKDFHKSGSQHKGTPGRRNNMAIQGNVEIKVKDDALLSAASTLKDRISDMRSSYDKVMEIVQKTGGYWIGLAGQADTGSVWRETPTGALSWNSRTTLTRSSGACPNIRMTCLRLPTFMWRQKRSRRRFRQASAQI